MNLFEATWLKLADSLTGQTGLADPKYQADPAQFLFDVLGFAPGSLEWSRHNGKHHQWDGDRDPFLQAADALGAKKNVALESGTGTGKTRFLAGIGLWFLGCFKNALVVTTAPKEKQIKLLLWREISALYPQFREHFPAARKVTMQVKMEPNNEQWIMVGFACGVGAEEEVATKAQGFHAVNMLFIMDEGAGTPMPVATAFENTCVAENNLRVIAGNPDHTKDTLHQCAEDPTFVNIRISALDHPNVVKNDPSIVPGAVTVKSVLAREKKYTKKGRLYHSRVRGICPTEAADALIKREWIRDCQALRLKEEGSPAMGLDVANSENGDLAASTFGIGPVCREVRDYRCPDANAWGADMVRYARAKNVPPGRCGIDTVGVGVGAYNEARRLGYNMAPLSGGAVMLDPEELFSSLRMQMWWQAAKDIQHGLVQLPDDEELVEDLVTPRWGTKNGKIWVEPKEDYKKRLGRSPNKGDSFVYWNWVRIPRAAATQIGTIINM